MKTPHTQTIRQAIRNSISKIRQARNDKKTCTLLGENTTLTIGDGSLLWGNGNGAFNFSGRWGDAGTYWFSLSRALEVAENLKNRGVENLQLITWNDARDSEEATCKAVICSLWGVRH